MRQVCSSPFLVADQMVGDDMLFFFLMMCVICSSVSDVSPLKSAASFASQQLSVGKKSKAVKTVCLEPFGFKCLAKRIVKIWMFLNIN